MNYQLDTKNFEIHPAQTFIIEKGVSKLNRYTKNFRDDASQLSIVISCHAKTPNSKPVFNTHIHLDIPGNNVAAVTSERNFSLSYNNAIDKVIRQLRTYKANLKGRHQYSQARQISGKSAKTA